ncbi:thioredoxin [Stappia sp. 28M-7]|uniref:thioredoxin n=1 Tax=Stappia sp. 28M-7 TaxID=2762596 RepID=UPI00163C8AAB|nr:thioredoxin [Stappia sp. 28M-7]MBC2861476.1 thioredoxin [Stappia sp. 28M-7]
MSNDGFSVGGSFGGSFGGGGYGTPPAPGGGASPAPGGAPAADVIRDVTTQTFMTDVIEASRKQPVLVDFWAPWCGPCKQLTPVLEKAVRDARGAVILAKMNIDDHPEVAGQLGIQSIPAVIAFKNGQPVDGFMGAQQESQVKAFIERIAGPVGPSDLEQVLAQAEAAREAGDLAQAAQLYAGALSMEPESAAAIGGLAQCYVAAEALDKAREVLAMAPEAAAADPAISAARAALDLAEQASNLGDLAGLEARIAEDPSDHQARFDLAVALGSSAARRQEAVDQLIEIVRRDREWNEDGARKQLLQFFEAWGHKDPATAYGRRRLSAVLFR